MAMKIAVHAVDSSVKIKINLKLALFAVCYHFGIAIDIYVPFTKRRDVYEISDTLAFL